MPITSRLLPLAQHKGPTLQLTQQDKALIKELNKQMRKWNYRLENCYTEMNTPWISAHDKGVCQRKIDDIVKELEFLRNEVRNVKINRYEQQKLEFIA